MKITTNPEGKVQIPIPDPVSGKYRSRRMNIPTLRRVWGTSSFRGSWLGLMLFCLFSIGCSLGVILYAVEGHSSVFTVIPILCAVSVPVLSACFPGQRQHPDKGTI